MEKKIFISFLKSCKDAVEDNIQFRRAENAKQKAAQMQREEQCKAQQAFLQRQALINTHSTNLRKLFSDALNALPAHLRVSSSLIDSMALKNAFENDAWLLSVNIPDGENYTPSNLIYLKNNLQNIFSNIYRDCVYAFENRLRADTSEYASLMLSNTIYQQPVLKTDTHFFNDYNKFYAENAYRLYEIVLVDIKTGDHLMYLRYQIHLNSLMYFAPANYFGHVHELLN